MWGPETSEMPFLDASELQRVQTALVATTESRLALIIRASMDAIVTVNRDQRVVLFNPAAERMFGYSAAEMIGEPLDRLLPERFRIAHRADVLAFGATGLTHRRMGALGEVVGLRADGTEFPIEASICKVETEGEVLYTAILRDITERKQWEAERARREREAVDMVRLLLESTAESIVGVDLEGRCTFANSAAARLLGYEQPEALLGQDMHALSHHSYPDGTPYPAEQCPLWRAVRRGDSIHVDREVFWRRDGSRFPVECWAHPVYHDGVLVGAVVSCLDISARLAAEEARAQLVAREREARVKDEVISLVSHELRTPLASVVGFSELLLSRDLDPAQQRECLAYILEEGRRLAQLIGDFLDLQRLESGRQPCQPIPTDIVPLLERAVAAAGIDPLRPVELAVEGPLPQVNADPARIMQVLGNLLSNARKYSPDGGPIEVRARRMGSWVAVSVRDRGLGLPAEALPRLGEKFYRVERADYRDIPGTGLGLAIVKQIVEAHGGILQVESPGPGFGTTVTFTLPEALVDVTP